MIPRGPGLLLALVKGCRDTGELTKYEGACIQHGSTTIVVFIEGAMLHKMR